MSAEALHIDIFNPPYLQSVYAVCITYKYIVLDGKMPDRRLKCDALKI